MRATAECLAADAAVGSSGGGGEGKGEEGGGGAPVSAADLVERWGQASDVWALGVTLLEAFTGGKPLFTSYAHALHRLCVDTRPLALPDHLSPLARDFLSRCLAINPEDRPTAEELLHHPFVAVDMSGVLREGGDDGSIAASTCNGSSQARDSSFSIDDSQEEGEGEGPGGEHGERADRPLGACGGEERRRTSGSMCEPRRSGEEDKSGGGAGVDGECAQGHDESTILHCGSPGPGHMLDGTTSSPAKKGPGLGGRITPVDRYTGTGMPPLAHLPHIGGPGRIASGASASGPGIGAVSMGYGTATLGSGTLEPQTATWQRALLT